MKRPLVAGLCAGESVLPDVKNRQGERSLLGVGGVHTGTTNEDTMHIDRRTMLAGTVAVAAAGAASGTRTVWAFDRNMTGATMTEQTNPLQTVLAYHEAWSNHDMDRAMRYIAENIICDAPAGRIEGAEAYRAFMGPFVKMLKSTKLLAAFGDDATAMIMYDTQTALVESGPGAEWLTIKNGKIVYSRFIFDRLPFEEARRKAQR